MSISLVNSIQAFGQTVTPGTHNAGNLFLAACTNDNSPTIPSRPSDWILLWSGGSATGATILAYKYAQSASEAFGTWTNADHVSLTVWDGGANTFVSPWLVSTNTATSANMNWAAQATNTFRDGVADTALFLYGHNRLTSNNLSAALGATTHLFEDTDGVFDIVGKYQLGRTTAWSGTSLTLTSAFWRTAVICLNEHAGYGFTGGSQTNPLEHLLVG